MKPMTPIHRVDLALWQNRPIPGSLDFFGTSPKDGFVSAAPLLSIRADSMARDDGGAPGPAPGQVYLPAWRRAYERLVKMLRQAYAQAEELSVEREHLITELQFLQISLLEREEISQARLQQIRKDEELRKRVVEAETAARLGGKELQIHFYQKLLELSEDELEVFKSCISNLVAENTELKEKLNEFESQVEIES